MRILLAALILGWANCASLTSSGDYNLTGGGDGGTLVLTSNGLDMRYEIEKAVRDYDVLVLDGSRGDFIVSSIIEFHDFKNKTILGVNGAVLRTQMQVSDSIKAALDSVGVHSMSSNGGGGKLSNGVYVREEAEMHTRQAIIDLTGDERETYRRSGIFLLSGCENWIIRNLAFEGPGPIDVGGADLLTICGGTTHIWVDHCSFTDGMDGNFDISERSDFITVSWCTFQYTDNAYDHRLSCLVGGNENPDHQGEDNLNITYSCCHWGRGCSGRMPLVRFGKVHILNCLYTSDIPGSLAINARRGSEVLVEGCVFDGESYPFIGVEQALAWQLRDNLFCKKFIARDKGTVSLPYPYEALTASEVRKAVGEGAGPTLEPEIPEPTVAFTIHLMGDSTMADKDTTKGNPERGWGMLFGEYFKPSVRVVNYAKNGRSTLSVINEGIWDRVKGSLRPGDYLFIEFGHNDEKVHKAGVGVPAWGAYQENLRTFISAAREAGATPVLLTPVARRKFTGGVLDETTHGDYPAAMKEVARQTGTILIDMESATIDWIKAAGDEASRPFFMWVEPGKCEAIPGGRQDDTHSTEAGARRNCRIVCDSIRMKIPSLSEHLSPYLDRSISPAERAEDLLSRLTLEQKASLMMAASPAIPELGVREYNWWNEALHGAARAGEATVFPQAIGMAASWNPELLKEVFTVTSTEQRIKYVQERRERGGNRRYRGLTVWTPNINIFRDPRWGRGQETYGEDPYLTAVMGQAVVEGLQGESRDGYDRLHACLKHYAIHSGPEPSRHRFDARDVSWRDRMETYLYAFERIVKNTDVQEVMCAYNRVDGKPCCGNDQLLSELLRERWGYKGLIVSDCGAIDDFYSPRGHQTFPGDAVSASANAVRTGTDLECGSSYRHLVEAVRQGKIRETDLDTSLRRLLTARFRLGEMDPDSFVCWNNVDESALACPEHHALARKMAQQTMVLLQNDGILPLKAGSKVQVLGPNAADSLSVLGNYNGTPRHAVTALEGLSERFEVTRDADIVIYVGGINPRLEGEEMKGEKPEGFLGGDRTSIELPSGQRHEIDSLARAGHKVILVNMSGSAMGLAPESEKCCAILQAWYGGEAAGEAVADVICGDVNPSGKLPVTFYRSTDDLPDFEDYDMAGRTYRYFTGTPLWAFGHGLSYTTFRFGRARVKDGALEVRVRNSGPREGTQTVQVYVSKDEDAEGPRMALRGFKRVSIPAGGSAVVRIPLGDEQLATFDKLSGTMKATPGHFTVYYGGSSADSELKHIRINKQ